jgi:tRNA (guanine37-N1)-methyltransferase
VDHIKTTEKLVNPDIILMTPQGKTYNQTKAKELSKKQELIFLCGHYKGVDERVSEYLATEEISIGDYILTGGELAALVVIDSLIRLLPGVVGDFDSVKSDSFEDGMLDCPYYTRPENLNGMVVPEVLLSGHHAEIEKWRKQQSLERTRQRQKDLFKNSAENL